MRMHILLGDKTAFVFFNKKTAPRMSELYDSIALCVSYRGKFHWREAEDKILFNAQAKAAILTAAQHAYTKLDGGGYMSIVLPELSNIKDSRYR